MSIHTSGERRPSSPRLDGSVRVTVFAAVLATGSILFAACDIRASESPSASDAQRAFSTPSSATGTARTSTSGTTTGSTAALPTGNPASGSAAVQEATPDALRFGTVPPYAEIISASIRGGTRSVQFVLTFADELPRAKPDANTTISVGFRLKVGDVAYVLVAIPSSEGWVLSATKGGDPTKVPGTLRVQGATATIVVPWSFFSGPQPFMWTGYVGWDQSATVRSYAVDIAPNYGEAPFPSA